MKIAFIGTHGVGKTALVYDLAAHLKRDSLDVDVVREVARDCPLPINEERTLDAQRWITFTRIAREYELGDKADILVCDRSTLDDYVYTYTKFGDDSLTLPVVSEWIRTYDLLFRVPINPSYLKDDGVRSVNGDFQKEIDETFDVLISRFGVEVYSFVSLEDVFERVKVLQKGF